MRTSEAVSRSAVGIGPDRSILEAAEIMERAGVGALAVVDDDRLVGIVTDRDLVRRGIARRVPVEGRIDSIMTAPVVTIDADAELEDCFPLFRTHGIRRLPVVRGERFVGMISIDDLLLRLAGQLADLSRPVAAELLFAHRDSPVPMTT